MIRVLVTALAVVLTVAGCTSLKMRDRGAQVAATSSKTVSELEDCVTLSFAKVPGYESRQLVAANGAEVKLVGRMTGIAAVVGVVEIVDRGQVRELTGYATGRQVGDPVVAVRTAVQHCAPLQ